ncbi:MAG TPA: GNAT family N-acetyltransferase [Solirubrobacteraceae bacterium]|nr:GNAT family N-acetyltransferase [Solirubrobacteraceae bacterium]
MPLDPRGRIVPRATPGVPDAASASFVVREGGRHDLSAMADNLEGGFASYRTWSHSGWEPPLRTEMLLGMLQRFTSDGSWSFIGLADHVPAGHVTARPEVDEQEAPVPDTTRLTHLFLRRDYWGSGLATILHDAMLDSMRERGYTRAVLWTPVGAARARGFYAKYGWQPTGALDPENSLGLELMEYALDLPPG